MSSPHVFQDGQTIFLEGEPSDSAYVIESGRVALLKEGSEGPINLGGLGAGAVLGELGAFDGQPRSATARAEGEFRLRRIAREEFLQMLDSDPAMNRAVMMQLVRRLRMATSMLAAARLENEAGSLILRRGLPARLRRSGLFPGGLLDFLFNRRRTLEAEGTSLVRPFVVLLAPFQGDEEGAAQTILSAVTAQTPGLSLKTHAKPLWGEDVSDPLKRQLAAQLNGRQALAAEGADLLIWGACDAATGRFLEMRFVSPRLPEDERPGMTSPHLWLPVPVSLEEAGEGWLALVRAALAAAMEPATAPHSRVLRDILASSVGKAENFMATPVLGISSEEQAMLHVAFGNAQATLGALQTGAEGYRAAIASYHAALALVPRYADDLWAAMQKLLGLAAQTLGERSGETTVLEVAADAYRAALEVVTRARSPREWAALQTRLGTVLYRLELKGEGGDESRLREALAAFQAALQVNTREEQPLRWAEITHTLAQVLQVYGGQQRNSEIIARAVEACRMVLDVRTRESMPVAWASTQNNLGSALFLLAKLDGSRERVEEAEAAFRAALEVYESYGARRTTALIHKNLDRLKALARNLKTRPVADIDWDSELPTPALAFGGEDGAGPDEAGPAADPPAEETESRSR